MPLSLACQQSTNGPVRLRKAPISKNAALTASELEDAKNPKL
jgi:hypothetical protein